MYGGYVWASIGLAGIALGGFIAYFSIRYARSHVRRSPSEKRLSKPVTE